MVWAQGTPDSLMSRPTGRRSGDIGAWHPIALNTPPNY
jgi:hypothetical protein